MEERGDNSRNQTTPEIRDQDELDPDRDAVYSEVYEHKTPHGSHGSSRNGSQHPNPYQNDANLSNVVIEDAESSREEMSPPAVPASTPGSIPVVTSPAVITRSKQPQSSKYEKVKQSSRNNTVDYDHRDPENLQESIKVNFGDIIAEPDGTHSFNTIWGSSFKVYSLTKYWIYRIMTLIFGIPCSLIWGVYFACLAFIGVWWIIPCIRAFSIKFKYFGKFWTLLIRTVLDPVFESVGLILSRIRVKMTKEQD